MDWLHGGGPVATELATGGLVSFVVHEDSLELFRQGRKVARRRGVSSGPVERGAPIRFRHKGSLGTRIQ
jgi:hypothetical protein